MAFLRSPDFFDFVDRHRMSLVKFALKGNGEVPGMAGCAAEPITSPQVIVAIERIVQGVLESLSRNEAPVLTVENRSTWTNIGFSDSVGLHMVKDCNTRKIRSDCPRSALHFALTMKILSVIHKLVQTDTYATKRDIFYDNVQLYGSQKTVDSIITDISCMLKIPRRSLHILSTSKGCVAGDLVFTEEDGTRVICNSNSSGKGIPDLNTRLFVRKLWDTFQIPIFTLVDGDPHGIEIMCIYKYGSVSMSFEAHNLTVPSVAWLGLLPSDIERLNIPEQALIPLSGEDQKKLSSLERRPYVSSQPLWKRELEMMSARKMKAEIQALTSLSPTYLTRVYLPNKLQFGGWI
ncbi:meiotic recombination protein SPO11 isoform X3 [Pyxicephalus adspersus]|uniref:meiotic recombination protein SPO11 isoform X3 n=1 Tax=Pyxicephalus adspersus TaxID=30357 RepID=UPI003B5BECC0